MGDEGLLRVLLGASSSLTSIADLLRWAEDEGGGVLLQVGAALGLFPEASSLLLAAFQTCASSSDSVLRAGRPQR